MTDKNYVYQKTAQNSDDESSLQETHNPNQSCCQKIYDAQIRVVHICCIQIVIVILLFLGYEIRCDLMECATEPAALGNAVGDLKLQFPSLFPSALDNAFTHLSSISPSLSPILAESKELGASVIQIASTTPNPPSLDNIESTASANISSELDFLVESENLDWLVKAPSSNIALVTINAYGRFTKHIRNHILYAERQHYNYFEVTNLYDNGRPATWDKIPAIFELFELGYQFVMHVDADAFFANCDLTLDNIIEQMSSQNKSWAFASDKWLMNAGIFFVQNTEMGHWFMQTAWDLYIPRAHKKLHNMDNGCFVKLLAGVTNTSAAFYDYGHGNKRYYDGNVDGKPMQKKRLAQGDTEPLLWRGTPPWMLEHILLLPKRSINSYKKDFQNGDFILHMASSWKPFEVWDIVKHENDLGCEISDYSQGTGNISVFNPDGQQRIRKQVAMIKGAKKKS